MSNETKAKKKPGRPPKAKAEEKSEQPQAEVVPEEKAEKTLSNVDMETTKQNVSDVEVYGDPGKWLCLSKASSKKEGWMKSTKSMNIPGYGCMVQVSEQQGDKLATSITSIPGVGVYESKYGGHRLCSHKQKNEPEV